MRLLKRDDVSQLITMKETLEIMREVFLEVANDGVVLPERIVIELANKKDAALFMPAYILGTGGIGIKTVCVFPGNVARGIPTINAQVLLIDPETGEVLSMMDGGIITAIRTGAASGLATEILSRSDSENLGVFGAGVQAKTQIEAVLEVRKIRQVKIFDTNPESARKLVHEMDKTGIYACEFTAVESPEAAVTDSDIIATATTSEVPVFDGNLLEPGTHINAIGSFKPAVREVDDITVKKSRIFLDSTPHALKETGDLIIPISNGVISENDIQGDLGSLVAGKNPGRKDKEAITLFKAVGMAIEDVAVAQRIFKKAEESNMGVIF